MATHFRLLGKTTERKIILRAYFGYVVFIDKLEDVLEGLDILALRVIPPDGVHPHRLVIVLVHRQIIWSYFQ